MLGVQGHEHLMGVLGAEPTSGKTKPPHCGLDITSYSMAAGGIATGPSSLMLQMLGRCLETSPLGWYHVGLVVESEDTYSCPTQFCPLLSQLVQRRGPCPEYPMPLL